MLQLAALPKTHPLYKLVRASACRDVHRHRSTLHQLLHTFGIGERERGCLPLALWPGEMDRTPQVEVQKGKRLYYVTTLELHLYCSIYPFFSGCVPSHIINSLCIPLFFRKCVPSHICSCSPDSSDVRGCGRCTGPRQRQGCREGGAGMHKGGLGRMRGGAGDAGVGAVRGGGRGGAGGGGGGRWAKQPGHRDGGLGTWVGARAC